jgi:hypothetical protein
MVSKEQVQAVCEGIRPSFPDAESNPPWFRNITSIRDPM